MRRIPVLGLAFSLAATAFGQERQAPRDRDILWKIVDNCLEASGTAEEYCKKCPQPIPSLVGECNKESSGWDEATLCRRTTNVFNTTSDFVSLQDQKMCGCPKDKEFFHGLVLPRAQVTGIEDADHLPKAAWQYAWDHAVEKIGDKGAIALVANQRAKRTQDQLHIHLVRLAEGARKKVLELGPRRVKDLSDVWSAAAEHASGAKLAKGEYGILVMYDAKASEFLVAATEGHAEKLYTVFKCPE